MDNELTRFAWPQATTRQLKDGVPHLQQQEMGVFEQLDLVRRKHTDKTELRLEKN